MKTTTTLLISAIMMAGAIQFTAAQNQDRVREGRSRTETEKRMEKSVREQRVDKKKTMAPKRTVIEKINHSQNRPTAQEQETQARPAPNQNHESQTRSSSQGSGNRNVSAPDQRNRGNDNAYRNNRQEPGNRSFVNRPSMHREPVQDPRVRQREEQNRQHERMARGHRAPDRYFWRWENRRDDHRHFASFHERHCHYCLGRGFTLGHHGFGRIHCSHCNGAGFFRIRFVNVHTCPLCFNFIDRSDRYEDYTLEELAWMETNRLDIALDLDEYQEEEIYLINFEYLTERRFNRNYTIQKRNREIRKVLDSDQRHEFSILYDDVPRELLCDHCARFGY